MRAAQPWRINRARVLRSRSTSAESRLWTVLRARRLDGLKFVRQCPIGPYFVDFACRECKIIVEIDGATHSTETERARDDQRSRHLMNEGYRIFRVHNTDIHDNPDGVADTLLAFVRAEID